jgi:hypothetical protein
MAITVQTQQGTTNNANAYAGVDAMKAYFADRGVSLASYSDDQLSQALVRATDFMDSRYQFIGGRLSPLQGTACPRYLRDGERLSFPQDVNTLEPSYLLTTAQWQAIERACIRLAKRALVSPDLMPDPTYDATGPLKKKTIKAGPVETSKEYGDKPPRFDADVPRYPEIDLLLRNAGLLASRSGGSLARG